MNLFLMRHANPAENLVKVETHTNETEETDAALIIETAVEDPEENERRLTSKARKKTAKIARNLDKLDLEFDAIFSSPYAYARQTAAIVADAFDIKKKAIVLSANLAPNGAAEKLIEEINALQEVENVLLVGHEPFLSRLIGLLATGSDGAGIGIKKAGLCKLSIEQLTNGRCANVEWLLTPGQLLTL